MAVEPYTIAAFIVSLSAMVTASAAVGAYRKVTALLDQVQSNTRVLHGEEDVEAWGGLVRMVHEHRDALRKTEDLEPARADGGQPRDD